MAINEPASPKVASLASQGLYDPASLTPDDVRAICATALARVPDHRQSRDCGVTPDLRANRHGPRDGAAGESVD